MRSYLVIMDESAEAAAALRWAARRAARNGFGVVILALVEPPEFVQWGGVQAAIEEEARLRAEAMVLQASGAIIEEAGVRPSILVREGEAVKVIDQYLKEDEAVAALVLGAAEDGGPGPLVTHFASVAGSLPCPLIVVPNALPDEALERS
ncbi:MAG TPA: universal stress protein [Allosphingosinicella sp.]|nr:universal stress protein [Allosphingosinicella sp.]